jgi:hypothetical protein
MPGAEPWEPGVEVLKRFCTHKEALVYFAVLGFALHGAAKRSLKAAAAISSGGGNRQSVQPASTAGSWAPVAGAAAAMAVTWYYIFCYIIEYTRAGGLNLFDDS